MSTSQPHPVFRRSTRLIWLLAALLTAVILSIGAASLITSLNRLPDVVFAPSYSLLNQSAEPVNSADMQGQVVVYNFIYTSCETVCPVMTGQMLQLQNRLAENGMLGSDVMLVTITFDPERDTPERLTTYAQHMNTRPEGWLWLTGEPSTIKQLVGAQFGVYFEKLTIDMLQGASEHGHGATGEPGYDFMHDTIFILVDERGIVRAEYQRFPGTDVMFHDVTGLVREKNARGLSQTIWQMARLLQADR